MQQNNNIATRFAGAGANGISCWEDPSAAARVQTFISERWPINLTVNVARSGRFGWMVSFPVRNGNWIRILWPKFEVPTGYYVKDTLDLLADCWCAKILIDPSVGVSPSCVVLGFRCRFIRLVELFLLGACFEARLVRAGLLRIRRGVSETCGEDSSEGNQADRVIFLLRLMWVSVR